MYSSFVTKCIRFMSGPFAGMTKVWEVIEHRLEESAFESRIDKQIEFILENDPNVPSMANGLCGFHVRKVRPLQDHAFHIGNNYWIGMQMGITVQNGDSCKIFVSDDPLIDVGDATIVYWGKVIIPGTWQDDIEEILNVAASRAADLKNELDARKHILDTD